MGFREPGKLDDFMAKRLFSEIHHMKVPGLSEEVFLEKKIASEKAYI